MSLHTLRRQKPSSDTTLTLNSHGAELPQAKKKSCIYARKGASCPTLSDPVDCGLPGFSTRAGVLQARTLERTGQYWSPDPSRALYFLLP